MNTNISKNITNHCSHFTAQPFYSISLSLSHHLSIRSKSERNPIQTNHCSFYFLFYLSHIHVVTHHRTQQWLYVLNLRTEQQILITIVRANLHVIFVLLFHRSSITRKVHPLRVFLSHARTRYRFANICKHTICTYNTIHIVYSTLCWSYLYYTRDDICIEWKIVHSLC